MLPSFHLKPACTEGLFSGSFRGLSEVEHFSTLGEAECAAASFYLNVTTLHKQSAYEDGFPWGLLTYCLLVLH